MDLTQFQKNGYQLAYLNPANASNPFVIVPGNGAAGISGGYVQANPDLVQALAGAGINARQVDSLGSTAKLGTYGLNEFNTDIKNLGTLSTSPTENPALKASLPVNSQASQPVNPAIPTGWNAVTYDAFKKANPTLEPTPYDTSVMLGQTTPKQQISLPSVNLQPGSSGAEVKQLQDYLVSAGYMTQAQVNTGYGVYGAQTTAAVAALQKALGVDNSSGVGYFGPLTRNALQGGSQTPTGPIGANSLSGTPSNPTLPTPPGNTGSVYSQIINGGMSGLFGTGGANGSTSGSTDPGVQNLLDYLRSSTPPPSEQAAYNTAYANSGVAGKQQAVSDLTAQLNSAVAEAGVASKTLESQAGGKDVTTAFLDRQQQEVSRQSAIKVLPIQAQLAAAQGNLQFAQTQFDNTFKLISEDASNQYKYQQSLRDAVFSFATEQQKTILAAQQKVDDHNFAMMTNNLDYAQSVASAAVAAGRADIAAQITKLDPKAANFTSQLAALQGKITPKTAAAGTAAGFKFDSDARNVLLGAGTSGTVIDHIQAGLQQGASIDSILASETGLPENQKTAFRQVLSGKNAGDDVKFLNQAYFKNLLSDAQLQKAASAAGYTKGGVLGIGAGVDVDGYLTSLDKTIESYRQAGYKDKEILKMMQQ